MAMRVKRGVRAQKDYGPCDVCRKEITKGSTYQWAKGFRGPKLKRHDECPTWKASELETGSMQAARAAQEEAEDALAALDQKDYEDHPETLVEYVGNILNDCSAAAEESQSMLEESFDNMPEGLQQGDTGQQLEERKDAVESWRDEMESWSFTGNDEPADDEDFDDWFQSVIEEARDIVQGLDA